jgi:hypothetical protein
MCHLFVVDLKPPIRCLLPLAGNVREDVCERLEALLQAQEEKQDADLRPVFARFKDRMVPHLPLIVFPPSLTVAELRRTRPILFLAIMTAASSERGTLQKALQRELLPILADRVFLTGDKSLDLVQSLLISTVWYCPPDNFEELKFYQLVHTAAIMALDIGLGRKPVPGPARKNSSNNGSSSGDGNILNQNWQTHPFRRHPLPDATSIESRRTWLACFFMTSNAAIALRRPNMVRWTPFMAESVEILETSPDAAPSDKYLCHLVWTHRLTEDIAAQFNLEDPSVITDVNEPRTQHVLRALERDMERYHASLPEAMAHRPTLRMSFNMVSLWLHEIVLHNKTAADQLRPPFNTDTFKSGIVALEPLSAAQVSAVSACIASADALFTTFLSLDVATIRCLPAYNYVRVAYSLEYGIDEMEMHKDAVQPGEKVILVDDLIATGGTAEGATRLLRQMGAEIVSACFVIDLPDLGDLEAVRRGQVFAVDGSAYFSRPGPRVIDGIELLAEIFDPDTFVDVAPPGSWTPVD